MAQTIADVTATVKAALTKLSPTDDIPDSARFELLDVLDQLRVAIEPPIQTVLNICWAVRSLIPRWSER